MKLRSELTVGLHINAVAVATYVFLLFDVCLHVFLQLFLMYVRVAAYRWPPSEQMNFDTNAKYKFLWKFPLEDVQLMKGRSTRSFTGQLTRILLSLTVFLTGPFHYAVE